MRGDDKSLAALLRSGFRPTTATCREGRVGRPAGLHPWPGARARPLAKMHLKMDAFLSAKSRRPWRLPRLAWRNPLDARRPAEAPRPRGGVRHRCAPPHRHPPQTRPSARHGHSRPATRGCVRAPWSRHAARPAAGARLQVSREGLGLDSEARHGEEPTRSMSSGSRSGQVEVRRPGARPARQPSSPASDPTRGTVPPRWSLWDGRQTRYGSASLVERPGRLSAVTRIQAGCRVRAGSPVLAGATVPRPSASPGFRPGTPARTRKAPPL